MKCKIYVRTGPIAFPTICKTNVLTSPSTRSEKLIIGSVEIGNSTGSTAKVGWGYQIPNDQWIAGQIDISETGSEYVDDTTDAQDVGTKDFALTTKTDDDGFLIGCKIPFNVIGITVGTNTSNGANTPAYAYTYSNGANTWQTLTLIDTPDFESATGDTYMSFLKPADWVQTSSDAYGIPDGYYCVKVIATTSPATTAPVADAIWLVDLIDYVEQVDDGKSVTLSASGETSIPFKAPMVPYCNVANASNWCSIEYRKC